MSEWIQFSVSQNWHMTTWLSMTALITRQVCAEDAAYEKKEASMKSSSPTLLPSGGQKENCWDVAIYIPSFMFLWHTTQSRFTFFFPAQRDNCVSSFRSHYVLIVIIYMLPGGCAIIKAPTLTGTKFGIHPAPGTEESDSTTIHQQWPQEAHAFTEAEMWGKMSATVI